MACLDGNKFKTISVINTGGRIVDVSEATKYYRISCRGGDTYKFDKEFHFIDNNYEPKKTIHISESQSNLKSTKSGNLYGIAYGNKELLNEQFNEIHIYDDKYAIVEMTNGNKGILRYNSVGSVLLKGPDGTIEFCHNTAIPIPISVTCSNLITNPCVEISCNNKVEKINGSSQVNFDFYDSHTEFDVVSTKQIPIGVTIDGLKLGIQTIDVRSTLIMKGLTSPQ